MEIELVTATAVAPGLDLRALGRGRVTLDGAPVALGPRQVELLLVLAIAGTATLDELHALLFGDRPISMATLRAEISHTRAAVRGAIASRPYRLTVPVRVDALDVLDRLHQGDLAGAVERYDSQLLPLSEAPLIVERRYHLDVALRTALLLNGTTSELLRFAAVHPFDVEVLRRAVAVAVPGIPTCRRRWPRWPSPPPSCDRARRRAGAARRRHRGGTRRDADRARGRRQDAPRDRLRGPAPGAHRGGRDRRAAGVDPRRCGGAGARRRPRASSRSTRRPSCSPSAAVSS